MEIAVKTELCPTKRHVSTLQSDSSVMGPKVVKRRRRDESKSESVRNQNQVDQSVNTDNTSTSSTKTSTVKRSSKFRGVSRHRWTGRYEAHLWDKGTWNPTQRKKGKQVYLGAYDEEESAARAYDLAALKYWGSSTFTNFPVSEYEHEMEIMKNLTKEEYLASLRRRSSGFSRGVSKYRGVARHHHNGRWEARIGRVFGNKYLYLGTYGTQEEAAHAYDIAAIEYRGINAVTNFDLSTYIRWLRPVSSPLIAQEPKFPMITNTNTITKTPNSFLIPSKENPNTRPSALNLNPFEALDDLDNKKQQDIFPRPVAEFSPSSSSSYSSPSALGLLLKSSVFRDLVEKNVFVENEELLESDVKSECHFDFISRESSYAFSGLESRDESAEVAFCAGGGGKSLWNFPLTSVDFD